MMIRSVCLKLHRWFGLLSAIFLIIVSLTGSLIAFNEELDIWLNPQLFLISPDSSVMLDPVSLFKKVSENIPKNYQIVDMPLFFEPGKSVYFSANGNSEQFAPLQIFVNPHNAEVLGQRIWGELSIDKKDLMPLINRIHYSLALDSIGSYILGITALFWTLDCFVGFYLTLPKKSSPTNSSLFSRTSWLQRWQKAWGIKLNSSFIRLNFDFHIALGLWTWLALLMFAWSSVAFNLSKEIYNPVTNFLFGMESINTLEISQNNANFSKMSWQDALKTGRDLISKQAQENHFDIIREDTLTYNAMGNTYQYLLKSSLDNSKWATTKVIFDASDGHLINKEWPGGHEKLGDVITRWLIWLHMAVVFGTAMQIFVCLIGLAITVITLTGVYIWWKKRQARQLMKSKHLTLNKRSS